MKGKLVTMAVSFLLCVGMVGAGFASWVITNTQTTETTGAINVEQVIDKRLKATIDTSGINVAFGAPEATDGKGWLKNDAYVYDTNGNIDITKSAPVEDLKSTVKIAMVSDNLSQLYKQGMETVTWTVTLKISASDNAVFKEAINAGLIVLPQAKNIATGEKIETSTDGMTITYTKVINLEEYENNAGANANLNVDLAFAWGDAFEGKNPYEYFNAEGIDPNSEDNLPIEEEKIVNGVYTVQGKAYPMTNWGDYAYYALNLIERIGTIQTKVTVTGVANEPSLD